MDRFQKIHRAHLIKKAFSVKDTNDSLTNCVQAGYNVNKLKDDELIRLASNECVSLLRDMLYHSDFSKDVWKAKISYLLELSGLTGKARVKKVANQCVKNLFGYLDDMGWF